VFPRIDLPYQVVPRGVDESGGGVGRPLGRRDLWGVP
jgi:hypothetical protein